MEPLKKILRTPSALVVLLAAIVALFGVIIQSKTNEAIARLPIDATLTAEAKLTEFAKIGLSTPKIAETETPVTTSIPMQFTTTPAEMATNNPSVYIAKWKGGTLYPGDTLIVSTLSCHDDENISSRNGEKPAYWIIYEIWISFTFVNSTDLPNGIISIEPIYQDDFERSWKLNNWYISIYENNNTDNPVSLPIELPPKTPRKFYF